MAPLRWGILSAGKISFDFCRGFSALPPQEHELVAVAARNLDNAKAFAKEFGIPTSYGSYEELVKNQDIDVVYIGSVNPQHLALGKLALSHGKHVLCEKPLCINVRETKELVAYAESKGLFLMEAIWSRFFPVYQRIKEEIKKGTIGDVLQVFVTFGLQIADVDRVKLKELGGGTILDIGVYCVQLACWAFDGEKPEKVIAGGHMNSCGVDESTSTTLVYAGGKTATLVTHGRVNLPNEGLIVGTKGTIKIEFPFWCPTTLIINEEKHEFPLPKGKDTNFRNSMGLSYQCNEVRRCITGGLKESPIVSHGETLLIAEIIESIRKQIGVVYPQDA